MRKTFVSLAGACLSTMLVTAPAMAADYPVRPVQIVVPYAAGGGTDLSARVMAEAIEKHLGKTMVVKNQPGGGGAIGVSAVSHAKPDGYTIGMGAQGPLAMLPHYGGLDYTVDSVDYLALMGRNLMLIGVHKNAPFQDAKSFFDYAKANPGKITIGNSGAGGASHIATEGLAMAAGIKVKSMPFAGSSTAITTCVGGHIDAVTAHPSELVNHVKSGNIKVILVMENERIKEFPDTPTAKESGVDFTWAAWKGVIGPKGMPDDVKAKLTDSLSKVFADPAFLEKMNGLGEYVEYMPGDKFREMAEADAVMAEKVIRSLGMYGMNAKK